MDCVVEFNAGRREGEERVAVKGEEVEMEGSEHGEMG